MKQFGTKKLEDNSAHSLLEVQRMETGIEFFLHLVAMERILAVFTRIQRKSRKRREAKVCDRTGQPVVCRILAKTSDEWVSFCFVPYRSFITDGGLLQSTGVVKTTPQKTRFLHVKNARIWDTDRVDDDRTQSDCNIQKERTLPSIANAC